MNSSAREKIFKSWSGLDEIALIKEVATKGEHVQLCMEYWAKKRKMPLKEYELYFHDVVQRYVERLLTERLVCKAENVLGNVQRDVRCFYFQFACECEDEELREQLLDHIQKKDPQSFPQDIQELQFNWDLLHQLQACPSVLAKCKAKMRRLNLEALMTCDAGFQKRFMVELYFDNKNPELLQRINKFVLWEFLIETRQTEEIIRWCYLNDSDEVDTIAPTELELKYCQWSLETEMFEYALKTMQNPGDVLRNCFVSKGFFFADERDVVPTVLRRICTTESFDRNREMLEKLPIGRYLLKQGYYYLMLQNFVASRELEELANEYSEHSDLLKIIIELKNNDLKERFGFEKIAQVTKTYLESVQVDFNSEQPLVTFFEFLCNEPTIASLNCFLLSSALKRIPYLKSLSYRLENSSNVCANKLPTPYDFLRKFKNIDFKEICKDTQEISKDPHEVASFSNERLCQKYARKYQLNFLHYLKQQRSSFAVYFLFTEQLKHYAQITKAQLFSACETVTELAIQHAANNEDLVAHCVAFNEMLGFDTQHLRNFLKLCRLLEADYVPSYEFLIRQVEKELVQHLDQQPDSFPLDDYQGLMRLVACNQHRQWPQLVLQRYARDDDWWRLLVLLQYFDIPLSQIKQLTEHFQTRAMGEHFLRALCQSDPPATERTAKRYNTSFSKQQKQGRKMENVTTTTSVETVTSSISSSHHHHDANTLIKSTNQHQMRFLSDSSSSLDLFAIILLSSSSMPEERIASTAKFLEIMQDTNSYATSLNLMKNSSKYHLPILALLAATVSPLNVDWNWLVWLAMSTDQWSDLKLFAVKDVQELSWRLIESTVRQGSTATLYRSFHIFYEDNPLVYFFKFLHQTQNKRNFSDEVVHDLRLYLLHWSNDEVRLPLCSSLKRDQLMLRSIKLLLVHLQLSFDSTLEQQKFLSCICRSDMSDISGLLDFCLLNEVFTLLQHCPGWSQRFPINFEQLLQRDSKEYEQLLAALIEAREYDLAIRLATLLHLPISDIVYSKWMASLDENMGLLQNLAYQRYEDEIIEHSLPPEILVNFFLHASSRLEDSWTRKYLLLKRGLDVIKKHHLFPNESFDRDQIEYEMILSYLQIEDDEEVETLEIYYSEYFEQIMLNERCVLYKSFLELKELAGIEDLNTSLKTPLTTAMQQRLEALLNRLLDEGDIVEALRLQELFEWRPIDLRFVVFCMALAEGVTTIYSMTSEERQLLSEIEKSSFAKFNRRTLDNIRGYSSPLKMLSEPELTDSCSTLEFEEIPSKEKQETLDTIQGIASKLKYGIGIGKRIVMAYRAAMYLDKEYLDVLRTKDTTVLLKSVAEEGCLHRLLVVSDILSSTQMTAQEIAELLAFEITTAVVRPRFYIFSADQQAKNTFKNADLWGYNIDRDLHLFLELTANTTKLGNCLLEYCDALKTYRKFQDNKPYEHSSAFEKLAEIITRYGCLPASHVVSSFMAPPTSPSLNSGHPQVLSHKKQNLIYVELLIKAHQCFVHDCSMEGIANVLNRAKVLNVVLSNAKSWSLIVRMLIGIARYREMFYCFDALIENEQFESLLGQFDEERAYGLRQAILSYLREYCPENGREFLKLAALHFLMYKDLAEMWEQDAQVVLSKILSVAKVPSAQLSEQLTMASLTSSTTVKTIIPKLRTSSELLTLLQQALENYTHATENYLLDNKLLLAQKSASMAEMIAMQIDLVSRALPHPCVCVMNVQTRDEFRELVNSELSVPQAMILSRAYGYDINWIEVLLSQYIILMKKYYLQDYLSHLPISDSIIDNIVKGFQLYAQRHKPSPQMEEHLAHLVEFVKSITLKYKLASLLALKSTVMSLINDQTIYYLKDTNYGRSESHNIPDM